MTKLRWWSNDHPQSPRSRESRRRSTKLRSSAWRELPGRPPAIGTGCPRNPVPCSASPLTASSRHARGVGLHGETSEERTKAAEDLFAETVKTLFGKTHPLIRTKFETHEHIPYFNIYRARTGQQAARMEAKNRHAGDTAEQDTDAPQTLVESTLVSKDGRVLGRPDVVDAHNAAIVEYKTGVGPDGETPTDSEMRQLRLYAFVAGENGIAIRKGIIERSNGDHDEVEISHTEAETEGQAGAGDAGRIQPSRRTILQAKPQPHPGKLAAIVHALRSAPPSGRHQNPSGNRSAALRSKERLRLSRVPRSCRFTSRRLEDRGPEGRRS